jgi:Sigma-70 factor, region 1.2
MGGRLKDDPVRVYLREMCAIPVLTRDEEIELSQHVLAHDQQAESAGKRLIEAIGSTRPAGLACSLPA